MKMNPVKRFFLFCSGANGEVLREPGCHVEHGKYAGIGATIFFTAVLATLSGGYAMYRVFDNPFVAYSFGALWGLIIFNLDRFIVSSIRKRKAGANLSPLKRVSLWSQEMGKAAPRLVLAVFISIVITHPLELRLFQSEIQGQLATDLTAERAGVEQRIKDEYADLDRLEQENGRLKDRRTELENEVNRRVKARTGELEGFSGSKLAGPGPRYAERTADLKEAQGELNIFKQQNDATIAANDLLIGQRRQERDTRIGAAKGTVDKSAGLLKQMDALTTMMWEHTSVLVAGIFIMLLFISLETAPILVKLFSSRGPYDDHLDAIEHEVYARQLQRTSDENDHINTEVALTRQMNAIRLAEEQVLYQNVWASLRTEMQDAQTEVFRQRLDAWKAAQLSRPSSAPMPFPAPPFTRAASSTNGSASTAAAPPPPPTTASSSAPTP